MKAFVSLLFAVLVLTSVGCKKDPPPGTSDAELIIKIVLDSTQERLDNLGQVSSIPAGNAAQHPDFNSISAHFIELISHNLVLPGGGEELYAGAETTAGGDTAIDFDEAKLVASGEEFIRIKIKDLTPGTYEYARVSVSYQNYDIKFNANGFNDLTGTLASFVGFNTYIGSYNVNTQSVTVNDDKLQGYWGFEISSPVVSVTEGQAPAGATTVPNPIAATSPIPPGSCLVTGEFATPLTISGDETENITVTLSFSTNKSFEWDDNDGNGEYDPVDGDVPVDMGLRGLVVTHDK